MRQLFGFSDPKKFRRSDDLLIKLLRIPVHHDRVIAKFAPFHTLEDRPERPQETAERRIGIRDKAFLVRWAR